ncbi:hypothetical protein [Aureimonas sp. SA4125]|uniref:hypothetical protein n=1 Tax=Aureimonas sp. SA4125 TaxID=2826993 RepID=UPI001CC3C765|nr:hypothetical protein [Aureimonas sp. SA4125]
MTDTTDTPSVCLSTARVHTARQVPEPAGQLRDQLWDLAFVGMDVLTANIRDKTLKTVRLYVEDDATLLLLSNVAKMPGAHPKTEFEGHVETWERRIAACPVREMSWTANLHSPTILMILSSRFSPPSSVSKAHRAREVARQICTAG